MLPCENQTGRTTLSWARFLIAHCPGTRPWDALEKLFWVWLAVCIGHLTAIVFGRLTFGDCRWTLNVWHLSLKAWHLAMVVGCLAFGGGRWVLGVERLMAIVVGLLTFGDCRWTLDVWRLSMGAWRLTIVVGRLTSDDYCWALGDCRWAIGLGRFALSDWRLTSTCLSLEIPTVELSLGLELTFEPNKPGQVPHYHGRRILRW